MNVGIGSANPGQSLDVQGTVRATAFIGNGAQLTGITSTVWTTTNTNDVYLPNNGNVGIGTTITSAGAALTVMNGNVGIGTWVPAGSLDVGSSGTINLRDSVDDLAVGEWRELFVEYGSCRQRRNKHHEHGRHGTTAGIGAGLVVMNGNVGIGTWDLPVQLYRLSAIWG